MKKFLAAFDLRDLQLVSGISCLGYGLFSVYPPACFITLGLILSAPVMLPSVLSMWRAK